MAKPKKKSALAASASKNLARVAGPPRMSPEQLAHTLMHAEESGEAERVTFDDGSRGWAVSGPDGKRQYLRATPEILAALERFEREGHPAH